VKQERNARLHPHDIGLLLLLAVVETASVLVRCTRSGEGSLGHDGWPLTRT
jgi:hypothetical protein